MKHLLGHLTPLFVDSAELGCCHLPDLNSSSSCWGWDNPRQPGERTGAVMAGKCAE